MERNMQLIIFSILAASILIIAAVIAYSIRDTPEVAKNQAPSAVIDSPADGQDYSIDQKINLRAISSFDPEMSRLKFSWDSNISGKIGYDEDVLTKLPVGTHKIILTVMDDKGALDTEEIEIYVYPPPVVCINSPCDEEEYCSGDMLFFDGRNCTSQYSSDLVYTWSSDVDGYFGNTEVFYFKLTRGSHLITLEVNDGLSKASEEITVEIFVNEDPVVVINSPEYNDVISAQAEIEFDGRGSYDPDGHDLEFTWSSNFDGIIGTEEYFESQLSANSHIITLRVDDGYGGISEKSIIIIVNSPPVAVCDVDKNGETGEKITFDASGSYDPDGDDITCTWNFGDGNKEVGLIVKHIYHFEGKYEVNLTVSDNKGAKDHYFYEITIIYVFRGPGILGHVYDLDTNKPLSDVRIRLWSYDSYYYNSTETDENGYYEIHTPDEELELSIDLYDYYYYEIDITVGEDEVVEEDIYLERYPPENAMVYGYVYDAETNDPIYDADVDMEDDDAYFNYTWTDFAGYYELNAPAGTFILYCYYTDYSNDIYYESHRSEIILKENQKIQHDIYLDIRIPTEANITFDFTSWDYISLKQTDIIYSSTESIREDLDANEDGQVSEAEVTAYETEMEVDYDEMYSLFFSTEDFILVDFIHYNYAYGSMDIELEDATGPTDSDEPITLIMEFGCESDSMIPISDTHDFDFIIYYDDPGYHYEFYVILPILYECNNYTAVENVNVTGTNPVYIDPLEEPPSYNGYDDVWMEMEIEMS